MVQAEITALSRLGYSLCEYFFHEYYTMRVSPPHDQVLLGLLMRQPRHGYELGRHFERPLGLGRIWRLNMSQMYALLKRLEDNGYIQGETQLQPDRPPKTVYHITPAGREAFLEWVAQPVEHMQNLRVEFLAKVYFHRQLGLPGLEALIDTQLEHCRAQHAGLIGQTVRARDDVDRLVLEFRAGQVQAIIDWLERCRATLGR